MSDLAVPPKDYLSSILRTKAKRRKYFGFAMLAIALGLLFFEYPYIVTVLRGPQPIYPPALDQEFSSGHIGYYYLTLALDPGAATSTGYVAVTNTIDEATNQVESSTTDQEYFIAFLKDHFVILEGDVGVTPSGTFTGIVKPLTDDLRQNIADNFTDVSSTDILPYMLSNDPVLGLGSIWVVLAAIVLMLWAVWILFRSMTDPDGQKRNRLHEWLAAAGYANIEALSEDLVASMGRMDAKIGNHRLTDKFLYRENYFFFNLYPLSQLFWIYKKIIQQRMYFIPIRKYYQVILNFKPKKAVAIQGPEAQVEEWITRIAGLQPGARVGYELQK